MRTAVILTARRERDSDIPFPLVPFEGETCLIDRTLGILEHLGFTQIILVTGFRTELFERYKSDNIKIIENPDYRFTASMASLATVKDFIHEDFLLIEGDTFYESKVVDALTHTGYKNCLAITEESGNGDEAFVEVDQGFITKISKDKHQLANFEGELLGICKISYEVFQRMISKWTTCSNLYMNYEYLLMDCTSVLERPCLMFKNLIWGDVDNQKNLLRLKNYIYPTLRRKENPFDKENLITHLETIFPDKDIRSEAKIEQIGGMSNKNFKVTIGTDEYVLRVPGNGSDGMVVRYYEEQNSLMACKLGISPAISYFDSKNGIKLAEYVNNAETLNSATIQRRNHLRQIAEIYKRLHHSNIRFNNDFNVFHEISNYENLLKENHVNMYSGYEEIRDHIFLLENRLNTLGITLTPCHNDSVPENFIKSTDGSIFLIDWEYSGMNDPIWDLAALFLESDFTNDSQEYLLDIYFDGKIPEQIKEKILIYQILMDVLWSLWTVIKESKGDDFGTYGKDRFSRAITNLQILNRF